MPLSVIELAEKQRLALLKQDVIAINDLLTAYKGLYENLRPEILSLADAIAGMENPTPAAVRKLRQYTSLMDELAAESAKFGSYLEVQINARALEALKLGDANTAQLIRQAAAGNKALTASLVRVPIEAIRELSVFLAKGGELYKRIQLMTGANVDRATEAIMRGVALGKNPRTIADLLNKSLGMNLTDAMRTMRTTQLWAYRSAAKANYIANSKVVTGWIWVAKEDESVCAACLAMHGTKHPPDEILDGHYNCRCAMVPMTILDAEQPIADGRGEEYFNSLTEDQQREMLGPGKFEAWQEGKFQFSDLASRTDNDVFGHMTVETTLKDLLGE